MVHIWCFEEPRKIKSLENRRVTVDVFHVANVNVVSSNLIGIILQKLDWLELIGRFCVQLSYEALLCSSVG